MRIAIVGCGYIAASYASALRHHPELELRGAWDVNPSNLGAFTQHFKCRAYESEKQLLEDVEVETVVNLTDPRGHYAVTSTALAAGKHVYSEKPLAMNGVEARSLVEMAAARGLMLASAPCSVLSETAETVRAAMQSGVIGKVRLAYANFDDGMIAPRLAPWNWRNEVGVPWPARDEFEVGCT
jgi:predicted dehydrogenase